MSGYHPPRFSNPPPCAAAAFPLTSCAAGSTVSQNAFPPCCTALAAIGVADEALSSQKSDVTVLAQLITDLKVSVDALDHAVEKAETGNLDKKAAAFSGGVSDAMVAVREACDKLEGVVDDGLWPLPKYREMLFLV